MTDKRHIPSCEDTARAKTFWANVEFKKYAVDVVAGTAWRLEYGRTFYAQARSAEKAINAVKRDAFGIPPGASFTARLAGPSELGCTQSGHQTPI